MLQHIQCIFCSVLFYTVSYIQCLLLLIETPGHGGGWAETPHTDRTGADVITETPTPGASKRRTRWDETPGGATPADSTPAGGMTPSGMTPSGTPGGLTPGGTTPGGSTPGGLTPGGFTPSGTTPTGAKAMAMATPTPGKWMSLLSLLYAMLWHSIHPSLKILQTVSVLPDFLSSVEVC